MTDRHDDELRDLLRAEADASMSTEPRPGFRRELRELLDEEWASADGSPPEASTTRDVTGSRRVLWVGMAAVTVAAISAGVFVVVRNDGDGVIAPAPADTIVEPAPATVQPDAVEPSPTTIDADVADSVPTPTAADPAPTTGVPPTTVAAPESIVLADWPFGRDPIFIDDLPHPLLPDAERSAAVTEVAAFDDPMTEFDGAFYDQVYVDVERQAWLRIATSFGPPGSAAVPQADRSEPLESGSLSQPWPVAVRRTDRPDGIEVVEFFDGPAVVVVAASGLDEAELVAVASTIERREGGAGWELPALSDGFDLWFENRADGVVTTAGHGWNLDGEFGVDARVGGVPTEFFEAQTVLFDGEWEPTSQALSTTTVGGQPAFVVERDDETIVVWEIDRGVYASVAVSPALDADLPATALRLASEVVFVDRTAWADATGAVCPDDPDIVDGCSQSLLLGGG